jgi:hypothetical protein
MKWFLDRYESELRQVTVVLWEQVRLEVVCCYLDNYSTLIKKTILSVLTELIFNLDETGLSDWENRKTKPVLVPTGKEESTSHYPIDRYIKYDTMFWSVSALGNSYYCMLIASNVDARNLSDVGVRHYIDLILERRQSASATADLFGSYITDIFFLVLQTNRQLLDCKDKLWILYVTIVRFVARIGCSK